MKTLIDKSIKITGIAKPNAKTTIFDLNQIPTLAEDATEEQKKEVREKEQENQKILNDRDFTALTIIAGRRLVVEFELEDAGVKTKERVLLSIPRTESEEEIKEFILSEIAKKL
jgi:hypothetical protein